MKEYKCILCESDNGKIFLIASDRYNSSKEYKYFRCTNCNIVTLEDRTNNKNFEAYNLEEPSIIQKFILWMSYNKLRKYKKSGKVLDFGCGAGNLSFFLLKNGYNVNCFEIDPIYQEHLEKKGLNVLKKISKDKYDIIVLDNVLEHLPNPIEVLKKLKKNLNDDGIFIISLPNINSLQFKIFKENWFHLDAPRHLNHFYKNSFSKLLERVNLNIIKKYYFNINIDPTGWWWSIKKSKNKISLSEQIILGLFVPLVFITSIFKTTGQIIYIIKK